MVPLQSYCVDPLIRQNLVTCGGGVETKYRWVEATAGNEGYPKVHEDFTITEKAPTTLSEITKIWIVIQLKRNENRHVSRSKSLSSCFINGVQIRDKGDGHRE